VLVASGDAVEGDRVRQIFLADGSEGGRESRDSGDFHPTTSGRVAIADVNGEC